MCIRDRPKGTVHTICNKIFITHILKNDRFRSQTIVRSYTAHLRSQYHKTATNNIRPNKSHKRIHIKALIVPTIWRKAGGVRRFVKSFRCKLLVLVKPYRTYFSDHIGPCSECLVITVVTRNVLNKHHNFGREQKRFCPLRLFLRWSYPCLLYTSRCV